MMTDEASSDIYVSFDIHTKQVSSTENKTRILNILCHEPEEGDSRHHPSKMLKQLQSNWSSWVLCIFPVDTLQS